MLKKIFISYIYGPRNAGDFALNYGALDLLNDVGDFEITGLSRFNDDHDQYQLTKVTLEECYRNFKLMPYPVSYDRKTLGLLGKGLAYVNGFPMLISMLTGLTFGRTKRIANEIRKSRMTLFNGGNLLFARSAKDIFRLLGIISIPCLANKLKVPVGFLPQSLPSSKNAMGSRIISSLFHNSAFTYFRESESMASFNPQDYPEMKSSLDIAFFIKETNSETAKQIISKLGLQEKKFVPIIVRATTLGDQAFLSHEKSIETIETVLRAVDRLLEDDLKPLFVVQTRADLEITKKCQEALKDKCEVPLLEEYDPLVLRGIYSLARGIFTYRLHAAIFALAVGTPALGVYREIWGKKMPGIYKDLGISNLCCNCECDADKDELLANIELLGDDSKLNSVRDVFLNKIDSYKEELVKFLRDQLLTVG